MARGFLQPDGPAACVLAVREAVAGVFLCGVLLGFEAEVRTAKSPVRRATGLFGEFGCGSRI